MPKLSEMFSGPMYEAMQQHALHVGQILWAWNLLHGEFFDLFEKFVMVGDNKTALAIWHAIGNDSAQRDMTVEALKAKFGEDNKALAEIRWASKKIKGLSYIRNNPAHTQITFGMFMREEGKPETIEFGYIPLEKTAKPAAFNKMITEPIKEKWDEQAGVIISIQRFISSCSSCLLDSNRPLPDKPILP